RAGGVGADVVTFNHVVGRAAADDLHAIGTIAADDVPRRRSAAADGVVGRPRVEGNACSAVGQGGGAGGVGADEVTRDQAPRGAAHLDAVAAAGNDIARAGRGPSDGVAT